MIIDVDNVTGEYPSLIVEWPTGIKYTAQTGGIGCDHPVCEGFVMGLPQLFEKFDDCSYGCHHLWEMEDARIKLADDLDIFFKDNHYDYLQIDRSRLKDLTEGWWPVIISRELGDHFMNGTHPGPFKGFIHTGNCD